MIIYPKQLILLYILITIVSPLCADLTQPQNNCTACVSNDILIDGTCYVKIRGCLKHIAGPKCIECQFGYVLVSPTCIRQAIYFNNTNLTYIPPVVIIVPETLTYDQIKLKVGEQNGPNFSTAHQYFLNKYTTQLGKGNIKDVQSISTKTGVYIIIIYQGDTLIQYQAVAYFDIQKNIRQWTFNILGNYKKNIYQADNFTKSILLDKLKNNTIYQINQQGDIITIDYINDLNINNITRVILNRNDLSSIDSLTNKLTIKTMSISDLGVQKVIALYPQFTGKVTSIQKIDQYYVVYAGPTLSISFKFSNYQFKINKPLKIALNAYQSSDTSLLNLLFSGFTTVFNYGDPQFVASTQYIAKQFPETVGGSITKVQSQVTTSTSYRISMTKLTGLFSLDMYQFLVWFNTSDLAYLIQGKKNGKIIYQDYYNYNADSTFLSNYKIIQNGSKIANIPPISSVLYKFTGNRKYYKIIYSRSQFSQFQYLTDLNKANFISYYIDGQNIVDIIAGQIIPRKTPQDLLKFIKNQQPTISIAIVKQIIYNLPTYLVTIATVTGSFKAQIQDKSGILSLIQFAKIDTNTCFDYDLNVPEISGQIINDINKLVKSSYPFQGFQIQLLQANVLFYSVNYRVIYANANLKQVSAMIQEYNGVLNILKILYENFGYQVLNPTPITNDYQLISSVIKNSDLTGSKIPFFTQVNTTYVKAQYNDGKSTYQIYYDKVNNRAYSQLLFTRSYLLVPDGFSLQNLLLPGNPSTIQNATLTKIVKLALTKYTIVINNSTLLFADKINNTYNLMFKGGFGYQKLQANNSNGIITLGKLIVTTYKDSDFSNCKKFDIQGRCLSCDVITQIEYQGYCYKALQGCLVQAGNYCIKCYPNYVKNNYKCNKDCNLFK